MRDQAAGLVILPLTVPRHYEVDDSTAAVDLAAYDGIVRFTRSALVNSGTLGVKLLHSADGTTGWADVTGGGFTTMTGEGTQTPAIDRRSLRRYVRAHVADTVISAYVADTVISAYVAIWITATPIRQ